MPGQMEEWRRQQISDRLEKFVKSRQQQIESAASIKLRFMRKADGTDQIYLGSHEYQIIDPAIEAFFLMGAHNSLEYEHHESGPELIGMVADLIGIAGGLYGVWHFIKSKISTSSQSEQEYLPFKGIASLSIEIRRKRANGDIEEKRVKLITMKGKISEQELQTAIQQALKLEIKKNRK